MRRTVAALFVGALVLASVLVSAGAQAAPTDGQFSARCSFKGILTFKPPLNQGENDFAFIKLAFKERRCVGANVTSGKGPGGAEGTIQCESGQVTGHVAAKLVINWDTGDRTDLNFFFEFGENTIRGVVVYGLFKGDDVKSRRFSMTPLKGDCAETPLVRSLIAGTISF
jgi:hypothetical protein